jgi:cell division protein FtsB
MAHGPGGAIDEGAANSAEHDRRYIYNGTPAGGHPSYAVRSNKRGIRRKFSTFNIILLLFGFGGGCVLYISNIIAINRLSSEINQLQARYAQIVNANTELRSDVSRKSGWERISGIASEQLGLRPAKTPPVWFTIDWDKAHELGIVAVPAP